jgi:hypothetical protein
VTYQVKDPEWWVLVNTTDISTRLNEHGVLLDTIEILEAVTNGGADQAQ